MLMVGVQGHLVSGVRMYLRVPGGSSMLEEQCVAEAGVLSRAQRFVAGTCGDLLGGPIHASMASLEFLQPVLGLDVSIELVPRALVLDAGSLNDEGTISRD